MSRLHQPSSDENCFSPVLLAQKKMKTAKEERAEKIKVNSLIILLMEFLFRQVILTFFCSGLCTMSTNESERD